MRPDRLNAVRNSTWYGLGVFVSSQTFIWLNASTSNIELRHVVSPPLLSYYSPSQSSLEEKISLTERTEDTEGRGRFEGESPL